MLRNIQVSFIRMERGRVNLQETEMKCSTTAVKVYTSHTEKKYYVLEGTVFSSGLIYLVEKY